MKASLPIFLFFLSTSLSLTAQTNFPVWNEFRSESYGFIIQYPDMWEVSEPSEGMFVFNHKDKKQSLGTYTILVERNIDTSTALGRQVRLKEDNQGSTLTKLGDRSLLTYKTVSSNNGMDIEIHHWVVVESNRLYHCWYSFPTHLRNTPQLVDEMTLAYKMIERLNFTNP